MDIVKLTINGKGVEIPAGTTILEAARQIGVYIPALCYHPDLPPAKGSTPAKAVYQGEKRIDNIRPDEGAKGCGLCLVEIQGEADLVGSCSTEARAGMVVVTENERIKAKRQENLIPILARHRHACLTCAQQEGCSRSQCSSNVPENERCCTRFGHCELQAVANYVGISPKTPKWMPTALPLLEKDPLFERDYNLCIGCTRCVRACRDLKGIEAIGFVYDERGEIQVGSLEPTLAESGCKFCTACVEVCPTGALMDKSVRPGRKQEDLVPCKEACPVHIDIPSYLRLVAQDRRDEANAVIREKVPFPGILGRVCFHPCEQACRRGEVNDPISICALKRYAADGDEGLWEKAGRSAADTGKKVAIVGAGPAGLTAAFYLRKAGHSVTIFEGREKAGGMMRYGIPGFRLPEHLLDKEICRILDLGILFEPNRSLGKEFTLDQLLKEGFDAVFLAVGAQLSRKISLEGSNLPGVLWGIDFLLQVAERKDVRLKDNLVVVIGGGNVAVDVALTALRCGAKQVAMACLEKRDEMPAHPWEVHRAVAEGVRLLPSWGPLRIVGEKGRITAIELVHCSSVFDDRRNFNPRFDDTKETIPADQVILAVGQAADLSFLNGHSILTGNGLITVDEETLLTGMKGVYAGGDVTSVPGGIIHAIAAGRKAASSIDKALGGSGEIDEVLFDRVAPGQRLGRDEGFSSWGRIKVPELGLEHRRTSFQEVSLGFSKEHALREASRCLQCDLRLFLRGNPSPLEKVLAFHEENVDRTPEAEGVFRLYDEDHNVLLIKGTANLQRELTQALKENEKAQWFDFEEDKMYSKKESELIQKYLQEHGRMPSAGSDEDDLF